ncbi:ribosomal protein L7/L12, putative [Babesia bigemina]|uniref:Ribosomal protein L7/L12, putative n=1 Tax=Babesia bigemina TaxID=5866 RepID=A0A061CYH2_BABBI|nr:ribosomal protein L7/L12, putative [Babesia bigemina]CDR93701.1 ribosomal protein L7/L12, putative [Babesia bigemina]|eukprot:XP_012765887.1 ribosomal protein L7/L12, putative [Babesia bigemina]
MYFCAPIARSALLARQCARFRRFSSSSYDIFKKIKDSSEGENASGQPSSAGGRKPSDRVIRLVDEILNLTLMEAADLCDLCQERLAGANINAGYLPGRTPFPHPHTFFSGAGMMPGAAPMGNMQFSPAAPTAQPAEPAAQAAAAPEPPSQPQQPAKKSTGTLTLTGFDSAKKIAVIKVVRTVTGLGLRESKELVESVPRQLKKDMAIDDIEKLAKEIEAAGGTVKID